MTEKSFSEPKSKTIWFVLLKDRKTPKLIKLLVAAELCLVPLPIILFALSLCMHRVLDGGALATNETSGPYFLGGHFRFLAGVLADRFTRIDVVFFELIAWLSMGILLLRFLTELVFFSKVNTGAILGRQRQSPGLFFFGWLVTGPGLLIVIIFLNQETSPLVAGVLQTSPRTFLLFQEVMLILSGLFLVEGFLLLIRILFFDEPNRITR